jgi:hypothetical protein
VGVAGRPAYAINTKITQPTIQINKTKKPRTIIDPTDSRLTEATLAAIRICSATVDADGVEADLAGGTIRVCRTFARSDRGVNAAPLFTHLGFGTESVRITRSQTTPIDAHTVRTTLVVEATSILIGSTLSVRTDKAGAAHAGLGAIAAQLTTGPGID